MKSKYKNLFSPLTIKNTTFKSRIEASPVSFDDLAFTKEHTLTDDCIGYFRVRASGGASMITVGDTIVHPSGRDTGKVAIQKLMVCYEDSIPTLSKLSDEIHRYDCIACLQLNHAGMLSTTEEFSGWGPDAIDFNECTDYDAPISDFDDDGSSGRSGIVQYLTEEMIETIVEAFGTSALRAKDCGFDMVMIHGGHGWLVHQFLSPFTNHRKDRFGGSLENRTRFLTMVIDRIRKYCGEDFLIELRYSADEYVEGGYGIEEAVKISKLVEDKVDILHVSGGNFLFPETEFVMIPSAFSDNATHLHLAEEVKKNVNTVVSTIGALVDPEMMEDIIASGKADMVALGRALVADPQLPDKARRNQTEEIRPCIRCTACLGNYRTRKVTCSVNPIAHRPWDALFPALPTTPKKVLIAGGGPAGMQAAITACERGHEVILCEKSGQLGGLIRYAKSVSFKKDMKRYLDYIVDKVQRMDIDIRLNTEVNQALIAEISPDYTIASVGSDAIVPKIEGVEKAHKIMDVYDNNPELGDNIVIVGGGLAGCEFAVELAMVGKKVTLVEMSNTIVKDAYPLHGAALMKEMGKYASLIDVTKNTLCTKITDEGVVCEDANGDELTIHSKAVVLAAGMKPLSNVVNDLREVSDEFVCIGDCKKPRQIKQAVLEAYDAAMNI